MKRLLIFLFITLSQATPLTEKTKEGITYHYIQAKAENVRITWKNDDNQIMGTFSNTADYLTKKGLNIDTLMNGGIFGNCSGDYKNPTNPNVGCVR